MIPPRNPRIIFFAKEGFIIQSMYLFQRMPRVKLVPRGWRRGDREISHGHHAGDREASHGHPRGDRGIPRGHLADHFAGGGRYMQHRLLNTCFQGGWKRYGREISYDHPAGDREILTATSRVTARYLAVPTFFPTTAGYFAAICRLQASFVNGGWGMTAGLVYRCGGCEGVAGGTWVGGGAGGDGGDMRTRMEEKGGAISDVSSVAWGVGGSRGP